MFDFLNHARRLSVAIQSGGRAWGRRLFSCQVCHPLGLSLPCSSLLLHHWRETALQFPQNSSAGGGWGVGVNKEGLVGQVWMAAWGVW